MTLPRIAFLPSPTQFCSLFACRATHSISAASRFASWPLPPNDAVPMAFNNLSVQFLPGAGTALPADDDAEFWALPTSTAGRYTAPVEGNDDAA